MEVGFDIELVVIDAKTKKLVLPYEEGGINLKKHTIPTIYGSGWIHTDGVMLEINPHPFACRMESGWSIKECLKGAEALIEKNYGRPVKLLALPNTTLDKEIWKKAKLETLLLGCQPTYSAYEIGDTPCKVAVDSHYPYRGGAGHIHFSLNYARVPWTMFTLSHETAKILCKLLDRTLGIIGVLLSPYPKLEALRRVTYGQAGNYRLQPHGLEYRTLSNFYMIHPTITSLIHKIGRKVVNDALVNWPVRYDFLSLSNEYIQKVINTNNVAAARRIYQLPIFQDFLMRNEIGNLDILTYFTKNSLLKLFPHSGIVENWLYGTEAITQYGWEDGVLPFWRRMRNGGGIDK